MSATTDITMPKTSLLDDRAIIRLSPLKEDTTADVVDFLQGLVTQDVLLLEKGAPLWSALLTPQGKALYDFILWGEGKSVLIDCEAIAVEGLIRRLTLYRLRRAIAIEVDPNITVHWSLIEADDKCIRGWPDPRLPDLGFRWLQESQDNALSAVTLWKKHRLILGVTEGQAELGQDKTLWLEANARELNGVSFTKGCYVGQENTARMNWRQKINRRLAVVQTENPPEDQGRCRIFYPDFQLAVISQRVAEWDKLPEGQHIITPSWLKPALEENA
ncbi:MAG: folate-binding protein [Zymomonas mobilis subsp. pomaceae]|uniref:Folate-binding protein YgfZ n=1 Tax=Zymomonas mobilis subsp. pomaceae (strain ATCC 29192 / DSM 22645 / JCM 10191 / CCUG 17912 / NBRC 13757 / NCIMB 11200 / NRRL B-4491 / Barker I) TaxID=579138 RepID=F8EVA1_ZYMMT|nr:folate-binding protein [Zymomonas mobilis]AEI38319.1 folate-binding protein YgfZ [Zymomonas mobilis subsp. pomaceae ATCC 29192]MDX5948008.1 folate-binding protein [Zymomonas mobilis subsp. pomaceae]GEB89338.1 glycine cleavage system protein T [Zymomonas mobilis subsp. pomaceae]